jgi:hypothetical protein
MGTAVVRAEVDEGGGGHGDVVQGESRRRLDRRSGQMEARVSFPDARPLYIRVWTVARNLFLGAFICKMFIPNLARLWDGWR